MTLKDLPALLGTRGPARLPWGPGAAARKSTPASAAPLSGGSPAGGWGTGDTQLTAGDPPGSAFSPQAALPGEAAAWKRDSD